MFTYVKAYPVDGCREMRKISNAQKKGDKPVIIIHFCINLHWPLASLTFC